MKVSARHGFWVLVSMFALTLSAAMPARADDDVASPQYAAWAKFKPGSSATLAGDISAQGMQMHLEMTNTLKSVDADNVVIETAAKSSFGPMGAPQTKTLPAKEPKPDVKDMGEKDVQAMGKTFKCKVYEMTGKAAAADGPHGGPHAGAGGGPPPGAKATIYMSDKVPGGVVKMEITSTGNPSITFTLTAMDVK